MTLELMVEALLEDRWIYLSRPYRPNQRLFVLLPIDHDDSPAQFGWLSVVDDYYGFICQVCNRPVKTILLNRWERLPIICSTCKLQWEVCTHCNCILPLDTGHPVHDRGIVCDICFSSYARCTECNIFVYGEDLVRAEGGRICPSCLEDGYSECYFCGRIRYSENGVWAADGDRFYCEDCEISRRVGRGAIHDYHCWEGRIIFRSVQDETDKLFLGVELETDEFNDVGDAAERLHELDEDEENYHLESDGSLNNGIEIVTQPCTLAHHKTEFAWQAITKIVKECGGKSQSAKTCGLHVHFNNSFWGGQVRYCVNTIKLLYLWEKFWDKFVLLSRRTGSNWLQYAARYGEDFSDCAYPERKVREIRETKSRYYAVNLHHRGTTELRIFQGTLNVKTLYATLELVDFLVRYVKSHTITELQAITFPKLIREIDSTKYPELRPYILARMRQQIENTEDN